MKSRGKVTEVEFQLTAPELQAEIVTCPRCNYRWQYRGSRILTTCHSCKSWIPVLPSVYDSIIAERNKDKIPYTCKACGYEGMRSKNRLMTSCGGCRKRILFREKRPLGVEPFRKNQVIEYLKNNPEGNAREITIALKSKPLHSILARMTREGLLSATLKENPNRKLVMYYSLK